MNTIAQGAATARQRPAPDDSFLHSLKTRYPVRMPVFLWQDKKGFWEKENDPK